MVLNNIVNIFKKKNIKKENNIVEEEKKKKIEEENKIKMKKLFKDYQDNKIINSKQDKWTVGYKNFIPIADKNKLMKSMNEEKANNLIKLFLIIFIGVILSYCASMFIRKNKIDMQRSLTRDFY